MWLWAQMHASAALFAMRHLEESYFVDSYHGQCWPIFGAGEVWQMIFLISNALPHPPSFPPSCPGPQLSWDGVRH